MVTFKKIFVLGLFVISSLSTYAVSMTEGPVSFSAVDDNERYMTIVVTVNDNSKVQMIDVPTSGYLDVYSILGVKVTSIIINSSQSEYSLPVTLPKGVYILKLGKVAKKIIAR